MLSFLVSSPGKEVVFRTKISFYLNSPEFKFWFYFINQIIIYITLWCTSIIILIKDLYGLEQNHLASSTPWFSWSWQLPKHHRIDSGVLSDHHWSSTSWYCYSTSCIPCHHYERCTQHPCALSWANYSWSSHQKYQKLVKYWVWRNEVYFRF